MSEAAPLLAAPLVAPLVVGAGVKALDYVMKARKQGEGRRSQPVDYGQGGTATPRGRNVQRGRLNANDAYNRAKREERKKEAQRRARERAEQGIDDLIGSEEDRKYAKQKRKERGIDEAMTPEQKKDAKLNYQYKEVTNPKRPSDPIKDLKKGRA